MHRFFTRALVGLAAVTASVPAFAPIAHAASPTFSIVTDAEFNGTYPVGSFTGCTHSGCGPTADPLLGGAPDGTPDDTGHCRYMPSRVVSEGHGHLNLHVYTDKKGKCHGVNMHLLNESITYGKYAIRFRADNLPGYHFVTLLWPENAKTGEIDGPEADIGNPWHGFVHQGAGFGPINGFRQSLPWDGAYHTFVVTWLPPSQGGITMTLDGKRLAGSGPSITEPETPMYLAFHVESIMGTSVRPAASVSGNVDIDYIKVWRET